MDDTATALPKRPRPPASGQRPRPAPRRSIEPHHVRRRWLALAVLAAAALVVGVIAGAGSGGTTIHRLAVHGPGYFSRIQTLAGIGQSSATSQFDRMEERISEQEARAKAAAELDSDTLEQRFAALEHDSSLDGDLAALKARKAAQLGAPQGQKQLEAPQGEQRS